jgi:hypothetical protein
MRIRIIQEPTKDCIDGIRLDRFRLGLQYEVGNTLGALFLAEGWAQPVPSDEPAVVIPIRDFDPDSMTPTPANLVREKFSVDESPSIAADRDRSRLPRFR